MKPAGTAALESLYFTYPHFDAPEGAARAGLTDAAKVAIVGAGPIGMTAALSLARQGVASVMFDNKATFNDGSRAICVSRASFHLFDQLGIAQPFLDKALGWTTGRTFYRGQQILEFQMPDAEHEKFRPMYNIQQQYIEAYLWEAVAANPLIQTRWQSEVIGVEDVDAGAVLTVRDPHETYRMQASWVIACDGARSPVRGMRGLRLKGENYEGRYVIADVQMDHDYPTIRRALFDPDCRRGGTVLVHRQPDNIWRIDYQLHDDERTEDALNEATVRASVSGVLHDIGYDGSWALEWWSVYSANTLALDDYRDGRVFFAGDSGHIVPIFGVRGLNNGLADAANIGWKLAWVVQGRAGEALLESYTPERRGATLDVFANATKSARFMTPNTFGWKLMRDAALSVALDHAWAGELANPRQFTPHAYEGSAGVLADDPAFDRGPKAGEMLGEVRLGAGFLSDHLGAGFTVLSFDAAFGAVEGAQGACVPEVAEALGADTHSAYLIRPDGYVAARWQVTDAATVQAALGSLIHATGEQS